MVFYYFSIKHELHKSNIELNNVGPVIMLLITDADILCNCRRVNVLHQFGM